MKNVSKIYMNILLNIKIYFYQIKVLFSYLFYSLIGLFSTYYKFLYK